MYQSLLYKEWIKTRDMIALMAIVFISVGVYSFMKIAETGRLMGMVNYWESTIQKGLSFFGYFEYLPLLLGILLAVTQYVPELQSKRLKLTLHLPLPEKNIMAVMLTYGLAVELVFILITVPLLLFGLSFRFPQEIVRGAFQLILPWFLAGLAAYLIASWICLEPQWKQRVLNCIPGVGMISFFFIGVKAGAYQPLIIYLIGLIVLAFTFSFYSARRFKEGKN
jgi:hypothetical protein